MQFLRSTSFLKRFPCTTDFRDCISESAKRAPSKLVYNESRSLLLTFHISRNSPTILLKQRLPIWITTPRPFRPHLRTLLIRIWLEAERRNPNITTTKPTLTRQSCFRPRFERFEHQMRYVWVHSQFKTSDSLIFVYRVIAEYMGMLYVATWRIRPYELYLTTKTQVVFNANISWQLI